MLQNTVQDDFFLTQILTHSFLPPFLFPCQLGLVGPPRLETVKTVLLGKTEALGMTSDHLQGISHSVVMSNGANTEGHML